MPATRHQGFEKALQVKNRIVIADFYAEYASLHAQKLPRNIDDVLRSVGAAPVRFWGQYWKGSPKMAP